MPPRFDNGGEGARRLDDMASEPRMWLGLRRLDAIGLSLCALFLSGASATAAVLPNATDPSAALGALAWQQVGGPGVLRSSSGRTSALPGGYPALGGSMVAWEGSGQITVADLATLTPRITIPVTQLNALAVSDSWIVYRAQGPRGEEALVGVPLTDPTQRLYIATATLASEIGRPALNGADVVFAYDTPRQSEIEIVHLSSGARQVLRASYRNAALLNPSILGGRLLYERVDRCRQQLRIAPIGSPGRHSPGRDHVLLSLPSTVKRDPGYQRGYEHAYNSASLCPNRAARHGSTTQLGPTALSDSTAYVTEIPSNPGDAHIISVSR